MEETMFRPHRWQALGGTPVTANTSARSRLRDPQSDLTAATARNVEPNPGDRHVAIREVSLVKPQALGEWLHSANPWGSRNAEPHSRSLMIRE
jgi:hypothetical protein